MQDSCQEAESGHFLGKLDTVLGEISHKFGDLAEKSNISACREALLDYWRRLLVTNESVNLTAIRSFDLGVGLHLVDSLQAGLVLPRGRVLDWGSGGGFPGVPLHLASLFLAGGSYWQVTCLDSRKKKMRAVGETFHGCRLASSPEFLWGRGEEVISEGNFSSVCMRAVAPVEKTIKWLDKRAQNWVVFASDQQAIEWDSYKPKLSRKGFSVERAHSYNLGASEGDRHLILIKTS